MLDWWERYLFSILSPLASRFPLTELLGFRLFVILSVFWWCLGSLLAESDEIMQDVVNSVVYGIQESFWFWVTWLRCKPDFLSRFYQDNLVPLDVVVTQSLVFRLILNLDVDLFLVYWTIAIYRVWNLWNLIRLWKGFCLVIYASCRARFSQSLAIFSRFRHQVSLVSNQFVYARQAASGIITLQPG
jgi:hypothetical protein